MKKLSSIHFLIFFGLVLLVNISHAARELCTNLENRTIKFGVITKGNEALTLQRWTPTFETYLTNHLNGYGCQTKLIPLDFSSYENLTAAGYIDFIFPNPTAYQEMHDRYGVEAIASVKRNFMDLDNNTHILERFGGVIARKAGALNNITSLSEINSLSSKPVVCGVNSNAFGGWHIQWYEFIKAGVDYSTAVTLKFVGNHEATLRGVLDGTCDIALARTETIERLIIDGEIPSENSLFVFHDRTDEDTKSFPQFLSTPLYPEWPVAALKHVNRDISQVVTVMLLSMSETTPEAIQGDHAGFAFPYSYDEVSNLFEAIDHYGTGECSGGEYRQTDFPAQCVPCPAGYYSDSGISTCSPCPIGFYTDTVGSIACQFCPNSTTTLSEASVSSDCMQVVVEEWSPSSLPLIIVGSVAMFGVGIVIVYMSRKSSSGLIGFLAVFQAGVIGKFVGFALELSDVVSDFVIAIAMLSVKELSVLPRPIRIAYVTLCFMTLVPSLYRGRVRIRDIRSVIVHQHESVAKLNTGRSVEEILQNETDAMQLMSDDLRRQETTYISIFLVLVFEDLVMTIMNIIVLASLVGNSSFNNNTLLGVFASAASTSLFMMGYRSACVISFLRSYRMSASLLKNRQERIAELNEELCHDSARVAFALEYYSSFYRIKYQSSQVSVAKSNRKIAPTALPSGMEDGLMKNF